MRIFCGGIRGTETLTGSEFNGYGGNTTSLWVESSSGEGMIIDLGSGIQVLKPLLRERHPSIIRVLMSHYHLDHVNGLPLFDPIYDETTVVECRGPVVSGHPCNEVFHKIMSPPLWPVPLTSLTRKNSFPEIPEGPFSWGPFTITAVPVAHFDGCLAFRVEETGADSAFVIASDIEWNLMTEVQKADFFQMCRSPFPVSLLLFDGHIHPDQMDRYAGWGHSSWPQGVEVVREAGVESLYVMHHAPYHTDSDLTEMEKACRQEMSEARFARQGQWIDI